MMINQGDWDKCPGLVFTCEIRYMFIFILTFVKPSTI